MPRQAQQTRAPTYLGAWRRHLKLGLVSVSAQLAERGYSLSFGQLSRIERGLQPYGQDTLEALARLYEQTPTTLLTVDPENPEGPGPMLTLWASLEPGQKSQALDLMRVLLGKRSPK